MSVSARLEVYWSRNFDYTARKRGVTDRRQTDRQTMAFIELLGRSQKKAFPEFVCEPY